jgi:hypothetical protein
MKRSMEGVEVGGLMPDMNGPQIVEQVLKFVAEKKLD